MERKDLDALLWPGGLQYPQVPAWYGSGSKKDTGEAITRVVVVV